MSKNTKNSEYVFTMRNKSNKNNQDGGLSFGRKKSPDEKLKREQVKQEKKKKLKTTKDKLFGIRKKKSEKVEKNDSGDKFLNPCAGKDFYLEPSLVDNLTDRSFTISNFGSIKTFTDVLKLGLLNFSFYVKDESIDFIKFSYKKDKDFDSIRDKLTTELSGIEFGSVKDSSLEKRIYTTDIITKIEISEQKYESYKSKVKNAAIGNVSGFFTKKNKSIKFKTIYNFKRDRKITTQIFSLNKLFKEKIKQYKNQKLSTEDALKDVNFIKIITDILKTKEVFGEPSINVYETCKSWEDNIKGKDNPNLYSKLFYDGFNDTIMFDEDAPKSIRISYKTIKECAKKFNTKDTKISYRAPLTRSEIYDFLNTVNEKVNEILKDKIVTNEGSQADTSKEIILSELFNKEPHKIKSGTLIKSLDKRLTYSDLEQFIKNYLSYHPATLISSGQTLNISMKDALGKMYVTTLISESVKKSQQLLSIIEKKEEKEVTDIIKSLETIPDNIIILKNNDDIKYITYINLIESEFKNKEIDHINNFKRIFKIIRDSKTAVSNIDETQIKTDEDKKTVKDKLDNIKRHTEAIKEDTDVSAKPDLINEPINELKKEILVMLSEYEKELSKKNKELLEYKKQEEKEKIEKIANTKGIGEDDKIYKYLEYLKKYFKDNTVTDFDKDVNYDITV
jgi:hypothetical protein